MITLSIVVASFVVYGVGFGATISNLIDRGWGQHNDSTWAAAVFWPITYPALIGYKVAAQKEKKQLPAAKVVSE